MILLRKYQRAGVINILSPGCIIPGAKITYFTIFAVMRLKSLLLLTAILLLTVRHAAADGYAPASVLGSAQNQAREEVPQKKQDQTYTNNVKLVANTPQKITHKLNTKKIKALVTGVDGKVVPVKINILDANTIEIIPSVDAAQAMLSVSGKPGQQTVFKEVLDITTRILIGVQNVSGSYIKSGGTVLPGYLPEPVIFGAGKYTTDPIFTNGNSVTNFAPGMPFLLGFQDKDFAKKAAANGWITNDSTLNTPYLFTQTERISLRATVEPLPDLRIDVTADRTISKNITEFYNYDQSSGAFNANSLSESGTFSMSTLTWGTAFFAIGKGEVHQSKAFEDLRNNRVIIANRLAQQRLADNNFGYNPNAPNPNYPGYPDGYGPNSVEVLVPAFLAAYQNKDPNKVSLGLFPSIKFIRPNWRIQYEGMISKIPGLNKIMRSLNFEHAYRSSYNVGSFITNLNYLAENDGFSYVRDFSDNFVAAYDFNSVSIMETFSPLINMDIMWMGDLTTRAEMKRSRNLNLSFANNQLTETVSNEYTAGIGYRFTQMDLIIKTKVTNQSLPI
ncbi:MAG: cell surface protein SprA [Bacteroidales bacterium]|nr:cell surface protein SprA [Bacteroidales bacterium]MDT8374686.1 cell surface protein SprA [Bacteroidales bacterium]